MNIRDGIKQLGMLASRLAREFRVGLWMKGIVSALPTETVVALVHDMAARGEKPAHNLRPLIGDLSIYPEQPLPVLDALLQEGVPQVINLLKDFYELRRADLMVLALGLEKATDETLDILLEGMTGHQHDVYSRYKEVDSQNPLWKRRFLGWASKREIFRALAAEHLIGLVKEPEKIASALQQDRQLLSQDALCQAAFKAEKIEALASLNLLLTAIGQENQDSYKKQRGRWLKEEICQVGGNTLVPSSASFHDLIRLGIKTGDVEAVTLAMTQFAVAHMKGGHVAQVVLQALARNSPDMAAIIMGGYLKVSLLEAEFDLLNNLRTRQDLVEKSWLVAQLLDRKPGQMDNLLGHARSNGDWSMVAWFVSVPGLRFTPAALGGALINAVQTADRKSVYEIIHALEGRVSDRDALRAWQEAQKNFQQGDQYAALLLQVFGNQIAHGLADQQREVGQDLALKALRILPGDSQEDPLKAVQDHLLAAVVAGCGEDVRLIVKNWPELRDARNVDGVTPLALAAFIGTEGFDMVRVLVSLNACLDAPVGDRGLTAVDFVTSGGAIEGKMVFEILRDKGGRAHISTQDRKDICRLRGVMGRLVKKCGRSVALAAFPASAPMS